MKKKLALTIVLLFIFNIAVNAGFSDISSHWAENYINDLTSKNILSGYPDGTFKPNNIITKGEFIKLIISSSNPGIDYTSVPKSFNHWAASYVYIAENYGVIETEAININNVDQPISRIDVIQILSLCDMNIRGNESKAESYLDFNDISELNPTQNIMLSHSVASGIISGYPDGSFKPNNNLTRGEVSKILSLYMDL